MEKRVGLYEIRNCKQKLELMACLTESRCLMVADWDIGGGGSPVQGDGFS